MGRLRTHTHPSSRTLHLLCPFPTKESVSKKACVVAPKKRAWCQGRKIFSRTSSCLSNPYCGVKVRVDLDKTTGIPYIVIGFEWDDKKAAANLRVHGASFEDGARAFGDPFAIERIDDRRVYGEERFILLGLYGHEVLYVAYTERGDNIRIISVRRATKDEKDNYYRQNAP